MQAPNRRVIVLIASALLAEGVGLRYGHAANAELWGVQLAGLLLVLGVAAELLLLSAGEKSDFDVVIGDRALKDRYRAMRRTKGATKVRAIWSADYSKVGIYFARERAYLVRARGLTVERLVDARLLDDALVQEGLMALLRDHADRLSVAETHCPWFECYLCSYTTRSGTEHLKALFVINDVLTRAPALGLYADSRDGPSQQSVAYAIEAWYENRVPKGRKLSELSQRELPGASRRSRLWRAVKRLAAAWLLESLRRLAEAARTTIARLVGVVLSLFGLAVLAVFLSHAGSGELWVIDFSLIALVLLVLIISYLLFHSPTLPVGVVTGEAALRRQYVEMRRTPGARLIQAIWSAKYQDVADYLLREREELQHAPDLRIQRLIDPFVLETPSLRLALGELGAPTPNLELAETVCPDFECFLCHYDHGDSQRVSALFVVNDAYERTPEVGILVSPTNDSESARFRPLTRTLREWFEHGLPQSPLRSTAPLSVVRGQRLSGSTEQGGPLSDPLGLPPVSGHDWDLSAGGYDEEVTQSTSDFLLPFMEAEHQLLRQAIDATVNTGRSGVTLLEVGSGTGRTLLRLAREGGGFRRVPELLIGIDNSREMLRVAESKQRAMLQKTTVGVLGRTTFAELDARNLTNVFSGGDIESGMDIEGGRAHAGLRNVDPGRYASSHKIVCNLLNTLGVLPDEGREIVLKEMRNAVSTQDWIVVSVFDAAAFAEEAPTLYRTLPKTVGIADLPDEAFDLGTTTFDYTDGGSGVRYFSHWFTRKEIIELVERCDCEIIEVQSVAGRGHFVIARRAA